MKVLARIAAVTVAIAACAGAAAGSAQAAPRSAVSRSAVSSSAVSRTTAPATPVILHRVKFTMRVEGFDPAMAKRDGYSIRKNAEGKEYAVKLNAKGRAIASTVVPDASVCGDGYIDYDALGNRKTIVYSGWWLNAGYSAIYFTWYIAGVDSAGIADQPFYGTPTSQGGTSTQWYIPTGWRETHSVTGSSYADVYNAQILLSDSGVCDPPPGLVAYTTIY
jgi:hypothetical protein